MSILDSFFNKIIARIGLSTDIPGALLESGEIAFTTDDQVGYLGNTTTAPPRIMTDKSTGTFDFSGTSLITLPGGIVFDTTKPGLVNGVNLTSLNQQTGLVVRASSNSFSSASITSPDGSIIVQNPNGTLGNIILEMNLAFPGLLNLIYSNLLTISNTPPANPLLGQQWFDTDDSTLYERVSDGTTAVWLDISA